MIKLIPIWPTFLSIKYSLREALLSLLFFHILHDLKYLRSLNIIDNLNLIARVAQIGTGQIAIVSWTIHCRQIKFTPWKFTLKTHLPLHHTVVHWNDISLMEDEALEGGVVLRTGMGPRVAISWDEITSMLWLRVVELVARLQDLFPKTDAHTDPSFQLADLELYPEVPVGTTIGFDQGKSFSYTIAGLLSSQVTINGYAGCFLIAPSAFEAAEGL